MMNGNNTNEERRCRPDPENIKRQQNKLTGRHKSISSVNDHGSRHDWGRKSVKILSRRRSLDNQGTKFTTRTTKARKFKRSASETSINRNFAVKILSRLRPRFLKRKKDESLELTETQSMTKSEKRYFNETRARLDKFLAAEYLDTTSEGEYVISSLSNEIGSRHISFECEQKDEHAAPSNSQEKKSGWENETHCHSQKQNIEADEGLLSTWSSSFFRGKQPPRFKFIPSSGSSYIVSSPNLNSKGIPVCIAAEQYSSSTPAEANFSPARRWKLNIDETRRPHSEVKNAQHVTGENEYSFYGVSEAITDGIRRVKNTKKKSEKKEGVPSNSQSNGSMHTPWGNPTSVPYRWSRHCIKSYPPSIDFGTSPQIAKKTVRPISKLMNEGHIISGGGVGRASSLRLIYSSPQSSGDDHSMRRKR